MRKPVSGIGQKGRARMSALLLATNGGTEAILIIIYIAVVVLEIAAL
jgi:hypothetical protein